MLSWRGQVKYNVGVCFLLSHLTWHFAVKFLYSKPTYRSPSSCTPLFLLNRNWLPREISLPLLVFFPHFSVYVWKSAVMKMADQSAIFYRNLTSKKDGIESVTVVLKVRHENLVCFQCQLIKAVGRTVFDVCKSWFIQISNIWWNLISNCWFIVFQWS